MKKVYLEHIWTEKSQTSLYTQQLPDQGLLCQQQHTESLDTIECFNASYLVMVLNPSPAEPHYALPLQTV